MRGCMTENESGREKGEEGESREEIAAAHGKHMNCMKNSIGSIYRGKRGGRGPSDWREKQGRRGVRQGRADPVSSAALLKI